jgi:pyrroloquinoline quinone biosynthesis protein E
VRTSTDPLTGRPVLLFPEGVLLLNETAAAVARRCDGTRTTSCIVAELSEEFDSVSPDEVAVVLQDLRGQGLLVHADG